MKLKLFPFVMVAFVVILMLSNTVAVKITRLGPFYFDGATILFPLAYIFADILTEVYGYRRSRIVIWTGFAANILMAGAYWFIGFLPAGEGWTGQEAYQTILGQVPRIVLASMAAYICGEFINSYILAKMKLFTRGKHLWTRTIGSTLVGEFADTAIFVTIAFYGTIPNELLVAMFLSNYVFKTSFEAAATPLTYLITGWLKKVDNIDYYDWHTDFNPFKVSLAEDLAGNETR